MFRANCRWIAALAAAGHSLPVLADGMAADDLAAMSLEQLSDVRVVSVSKREERLGDAPASVFVISADDIRRSGARSIPEALRLAPTVHVAQQPGGSYTTTSRGFAGNGANKQLVMIDGRSIYSPLFSGVFWDAQYVPMENIERIEVVSGPGGTLWGTNAVNGVINVITKAAAATQGTMVDARWGQHQSGLAFRHGAAADGGAWQAYGMGYAMPSGVDLAERKLGDAWHFAQVGFRRDWKHGGDALVVQGDAYRSGRGQITALGAPAPPNAALRGANVLARWTRQFADSSQLDLNIYYDRTERLHPGAFGEDLDVVDVQALYNFAPHGRHALSAGAGYRIGRDRVTNIGGVAFLPEKMTLRWSNLLVQDAVTLGADWKLTAGLRVERNIYTGTEFLPNVRLAWKASPDSLWWGALSRTVRAPSRLDRDAYLSSPVISIIGGQDFVSETARVLEVGHRQQLGSRASYSVTLYRSLYDRLRAASMPRPRAVAIVNALRGETRGVEAWGSYQASQDWRLHAGVTLNHIEFSVMPGANPLPGATRENFDPRYMAQLRSSLTLGEGRDLDVTLRRVGELRFAGIPGYSALDVNFNWQLRRGLSLSLGATNALDRDHEEIRNSNLLVRRVALGRAAFVRLVSQF